MQAEDTSRSATDAVASDGIDTGTQEQQRSQRWHSVLFWTAALALVAIAVALRLYQLGQPFDRDGYDEGVYWQTLRSMSAGHSLYAQTFYSQPPFFMLSLYPAFALFGSSLWSARLGVALLSLLGLAGAFFLAKALGGRVAAIAALLLLIFNPLYTGLSQTLESEAPSTAFSLLAVGLAYLWWENPGGAGSLFFAALSGIALSLAILTKLLSVSAVVPIAALLLLRLWQTRQQPPQLPGATTHALRPLLVFSLAALFTLLLVMLPFTGDLLSFYREAIKFHLVAKSVFNGAQPMNSQIIGTFLLTSPLLTLAALFGLVSALARRNWHVLPILAWLLVTLYLLWTQIPLFPRHMVALLPPMIGLAALGLRGFQPSTAWFSRPRAAQIVAGIAFVLILLATGVDAWQYQASYSTQQMKGTDATARLERRIAHDLDASITPGQQVITDGQFIAGLANRDTPSQLVDTSTVRIMSGYLTLQQLETEAAQPQVHAVLFFTGRLRLPPIAAFHAWVAQRFHLVATYAPNQELWAR